jgi:hypothetical protein
MLAMPLATTYSKQLNNAENLDQVSVIQYNPQMLQSTASSSVYNRQNLNLTINNTNAAFIYNGTTSPLQLQLNVTGNLSTNANFVVAASMMKPKVQPLIFQPIIKKGQEVESSEINIPKIYISTANAASNFKNTPYSVVIGPGTVLNMKLSSTSPADVASINITLNAPVISPNPKLTTPSATPKKNYNFLIIIGVVIFIIILFLFLRKRSL